MDRSPRSRKQRQAPFDPLAHRYEAEVHGGLVALKCISLNPQQIGGGPRGKIGPFSRQSRMRMFRTVNTIDWPKAKTGVFVTLTFPDWPKAPRARQRLRWLAEWRRRMERYLGHEISGLWRVEWLPRRTGNHVGLLMPHFHLVLFTVRFIPKDLVRTEWASVIGHNDYVQTRIERLANEKAHGAYIAKYCAKVVDPVVLSLSHIAASDGKHWGVINRLLLPRSQREYFVDVPVATAMALRKVAAENLKWYELETDKGFCLFTRFGRRLARACLQLLLDSDAVNR